MPDDAPEPDPDHALLPAIQWVPLGTLTVYHITEQELDQLEKGTPESTYFGFAIFLLSAGISFLISLLTTGIKSERLYDTYNARHFQSVDPLGIRAVTPEEFLSILGGR